MDNVIKILSSIGSCFYVSNPRIGDENSEISVTEPLVNNETEKEIIYYLNSRIFKVKFEFEKRVEFKLQEERKKKRKK